MSSAFRRLHLVPIVPGLAVGTRPARAEAPADTLHDRLAAAVDLPTLAARWRTRPA